MILETGAFAGYQIAVRQISADCQIYLGPEDLTRFIPPASRRMCAGRRLAASFVDVAHEADVVIFAANWRDWSVKRLPTTIENFGFRPDQKLIVVGRKQFGIINRPMAIGKTPEQLAAMRVPSRDYQISVVDQMRRTLPADFCRRPCRALICGGDTCPLFTPDGELISGDGSHLTPAGARYVGGLLFADPRLRPYAGNAAAQGTASAPTTSGG